MSKKNLKTPVLKIVHWNCNSLSNKKELLELLINKYQPDIVMLNEIKLDKQKANSLLNIRDYLSIHKFRISRGGGVAILIKNNVEFNELVELDSLNFEIIGIKVPPPNHKNPLDPSIFEYIEKRFDYFVIGGDLNSKLSSLGNKTNDNDPRFLIVNDDCPTFTLSHRDYSSVLDLFILSNDDLLSDHFPIELELGFELLKIESNHRSTLNYRKANWEKFKRSLDSCVFDLLSGDINHINSQISNQILDAANSAIPKFTPKKFKKLLPAYIVELISKRKVLKKVKNKTRITSAECNKLTNKIRFEIEKFKSENWNTFLKSLGPNPNSSRPFWKKVNSFKKNSSGNTSQPLDLTTYVTVC
ncbi:RNA-directed DNA polymerase from mobile element jockey-like [Brachionus plicatilis]|uniref:RNA-directed DNA polymerase from mobile element jockey-like n=1 Tax=Brachionus plicatilis TaxID=10195 RepID=A0A3M7R4E7_BRAPC|nr:RNA-directed DNA polymerase from mobile element jockey-like [Brachionus plicatilis]